jgi:hypothetical protein
MQKLSEQIGHLDFASSEQSLFDALTSALGNVLDRILVFRHRAGSISVCDA